MIDSEIKNTENDSEIQFDHPLEEEGDEIEIKNGNRTIFTDKGDPEIDSLYGKHKRGKLVVQPDFQRQFVWDKSKSSKLIESALLDIPLPVIYLSQQKDGKEYVIDGQQRLTAFFSFIDGTFPDQTEFRLTGLKVFKELERKKFSEIDDTLQDKIKSCSIRTITFRKESDPNLKFEVFERLNTGSVSLNDQELRNCIYRGYYNELLRELSLDKDFRKLLSITKPDKRMKDVELVLRFSSFYHNTYLKYKSPMRKFLNEEMESRQHITEKEAKDLREAFKNTVQILLSLLGDKAFKRFYKGDEKNPDGRWETMKFNASLYDIMMYSFASVSKNAVMANLDSIKESLIDLMTTDQEFIDSIELSTSSVQAVKKRFSKWCSRLEGIIGVGQKERRCFSYELKEKLFKDNKTCALCSQQIQDIDGSAVDHIEQYWLGGKTIPENARLVHRYCNCARPRKENSER